MTPFKPEYAGQLNFYLSAIDAQVKAKEDQPTIGLLLCKEKNRLLAEYALRGVAKPLGVAEYQFMREVPESLETDLPTIDQIEAELRPDFLTQAPRIFQHPLLSINCEATVRYLAIKSFALSHSGSSGRASKFLCATATMRLRPFSNALSVCAGSTLRGNQK
ncbi:hypothetical protein QF025_007033 [Paraburkholderia graminis]|uniref:YhcG PDDEXK nuclease domain-containing protein n=1 Tax=Paraburkholderia graminis TaxID=60548 RepID=A0ABD5CSP4_9BURK|nr:hypothetical protein [Paraburkholderia graminis]